MAFVFDPSDPISQLRVNVGYFDMALPFDDGFFESMLLLAGNDVPTATRTIAAALAAYYAQQPSSVGSNGSTVSWAERVKQWNLIAAGAAVGSSSTTDAAAFSYPANRVDGYSAL